MIAEDECRLKVEPTSEGLAFYLLSEGNFPLVDVNNLAAIVQKPKAVGAAPDDTGLNGGGIPPWPPTNRPEEPWRPRRPKKSTATQQKSLLIATLVKLGECMLFASAFTGAYIYLHNERPAPKPQSVQKSRVTAQP